MRRTFTVTVVVALVALFAWWRTAPQRGGRSPGSTGTTVTLPPGTLPRTGPGVPPDDPSAASPEEEAADPLATLGDARAAAWAKVDLDALRRDLPDNVYWTMSMPTKDPAVLQAREDERARWNVEYGKVLSNTATAEEIDAYYAHRRKLSADYVQFAGHILTRYGDQLPQQDRGLLKLAIDMHLAQLEEIPRQIAEANARREAHEAARRAWLEEQKAFGKETEPQH